MSDAARKPRIALMGEFSAGKSTLSNLLLGARPLPEKVTATRLAPVWLSYGTDAPYRVDIDGTQEPVSIEALEGIDVEATKVVRLFFEADILQVCDLIDFPGISDPNMSSDVWMRMMGEVDAVLWCTHATQAWRQSEAAVWDTIPEAVRARSVLLVTKYDKLTTERDKYRVLARLKKETEGKFGAIFPISLIAALEAGEDYEAFEASGGGAFLEHLIPLIDELNGTVSTMQQSLYATSAPTPETPEKPVAAEPDPTPTAQLSAAHASEQEPISPIETEITQQPLSAFSEAIKQTPDPVPDATTSLDAAAMENEGPAVHVNTSKPVVHVDSNEPIAAPAAPVDAVSARILPKRVSPGTKVSRRPNRPVAKGQVLSMDKASDIEAHQRPRSTQANQLRSLFVNGSDAASPQ